MIILTINSKKEAKDNLILEENLSWHCISNKDNKNCVSNDCQMKNILTLFGRKHTLSIIRLLLQFNKLRFNEILKEIGGSPKTITERLKELVSNGILIRRSFNEIPIRVEYSLTEAGKNLEDIFERISRWSMGFIKKKEE